MGKLNSNSLLRNLSNLLIHKHEKQQPEKHIVARHRAFAGGCVCLLQKR